MLDFRVVIAACVAGIVILFGGIGLVASVKIAHDPVARPANRIAERPRPESNASLPLVIETPAVKPAPAREAVRTPEPAQVPAPIPAPVPVAAPEPEPAAVAPPVEARVPAQAQPAPVEITGTITPRSAPMGAAPEIPAPAIPAAVAPAATEPVENPMAVAGPPVRTKSALPVRTKTAAKKTPQRRPVAPRPVEPQNPFSAIFGGFTNQ
jgi:hypothetical protein